MLTGKPPFQSTTADEIYRRAREREYDWPKLNTSENFISQETKDLVSAMLQAPEKRPDPDTIVQHPFFTCGWMPQSEEMIPDLREKAPTGDQFLSIGVRAGRSNLYLRNLKKLASQCDVGPWNPKKSHTSTYREVAAEEKAGLTPAVPLPDGVVYRPFAEWVKEQSQLIVEDEDDFEGSSAAPTSKPIEQARVPASRPATQSFAAQQRARPGPSNLNQPIRAGRTRQPSGQSSKSAAESSSGPAVNIPTRNKSRKVETRVSEEVADVEDRLANDLMNQLNKADVERKSHEAETIDLTVEKPASIFNPREKLELFPNTNPDHVLEGLRRLQSELERALNSRSMALESRRTAPHPTIVVKWVDYTNKFGLGYILSNGSVGCVFRGTPVDPSDGSKGNLPPSCIIVKDAERHLQNRRNPAYVDRQQIVPISGPNIEFYENRGEEGISRGKVGPQNYKITVKDGESGKLSRGVDEWDDRKREKIVLWKKFANYMTAFGRDQDYPYETLAIAPPEKQTEAATAGNVITFYQRWGDVGCWGFSDGHFQVCSNHLSISDFD
jgi:hypothetical protein